MKYQFGKTLLQVKDVSIKLGGTQILRDINLEVRDIMRPDVVQGQIIALLGRSGVGKSTLFGLLAGLTTPDTGTIDIYDYDCNRAIDLDTMIPVKAGDMGVVYQNYYMFGWRKIRTLLSTAVSKNTLVKVEDRKDLITQTVADLNLTDHLDKYPDMLSGGQQQRAAIAEQILSGSEFLLLDEPFSGLDYLTIDKVMNILVKVGNSSEYKTLIIVSHDIANTIAISDHVYIMAREEGKEGATITKEINLIERGLAWTSDVKERPEFLNTLKEIKSLL